ncbi:unnamed protein product [Durusdinium trenchii]|uniref:COMM domain-containing protein n=1 Tax=Durusdinium trenchii TaxID=1381693 RepID=A0ABP0N7I7_9DINO
MASEVKQILDRFADSSGCLDRKVLLRTICRVAPDLSSRQVELLLSKLGIGETEVPCHLFVEKIFRRYEYKVTLRAVSIRSDWQLPVVLAPLRARLHALGASDVSVIMEVGPEAFVALCNERLEEIVRGETGDAVMKQLDSWTSILH